MNRLKQYKTKSLIFNMLMMMNEEKQSVDVSEQPIVFGGCISFFFLSAFAV